MEYDLKKMAFNPKAYHKRDKEFLIDMFRWSATIEGHDYWSKAHRGDVPFNHWWPKACNMFKQYMKENEIEAE